MKIDLDEQKLYYSISEIAVLFDINASVIRYWQKEFKQLRPIKNAKGERRYTKRDIEVIQKIYILLREKGFTIDGAKKEIANTGGLFELKAEEKTTIVDRLEKIKLTLMDLKSMAGK